MTPETINQVEAERMIETLRLGIPSRKYASAYSRGNESFLANVQKRHLDSGLIGGKIRFISGGWGSGKTHFLRLLREKAFNAQFLVSPVELTNDATPFDKFEKVFYEIVRNVTTPEMYEDGDLNDTTPFAQVLQRALFGRKADSHECITDEQYQEQYEKLMANDGIDIDFRRAVTKYWETFLPEGGDQGALNDIRGTLLQWFSGEGTIGTFRPRFGILKLITKENAKIMLASLSKFAQHIGCKGVLILFDESQDAYSTMRRPNLRQAHNNLLHLINTLDGLDGLILIYAATPDFFNDERHGILVYGALAQRIGQPVTNKPPRALDKVWNFDAVESTLDDYLDAACQIRNIYLIAYPPDTAPQSEEEFRDYISELVEIHPEFSAVRMWRVVTSAAVAHLDSYFEGEPTRSPEEAYEDIMANIRER